jgi:hypothetical protein
MNEPYEILVGRINGAPAFLIEREDMADEVTDEDKAISVKKCIIGMQNEYVHKLKEFSENKYEKYSFN